MTHSSLLIRLFALVLAFMPLSAAAQEVVGGVEFFKNAGVDFDKVELRIAEVASGLHVLYGVGGNVLVSTGEQGVLLVDDQFPVLVPKIQAAIESLGGGPVDFVINTHWHFDHSGGNQLLAENGTWLVAHENSREMMTSRQLINLVNALVEQPAAEAAALPVLTFADRMRVHFNGNTIDLLHFGPAHTTGDVAVLFREKNVLHMGDIYNGGYPFIDADNGGSLDGAISFCEAVLAEIGPDTVVIPGHGRVGTGADLKAFTQMLKTIRTRIADLIEEGASLEEIMAAQPTAEWDGQRGNPARLINRAYKSLSAEQ